MHAIMVQATPMDADVEHFGIECSECGPVEIVAENDAKEAVTAHMVSHKAQHVVEVDGPQFSD